MKFISLFALNLIFTHALAAAPCDGDVKKLCSGLAFPEAAKCLYQKEAQLSVSCKSILNESLSKTPKCQSAVASICGGKKVGEGLGKCLVENEKSLGEACRRGEK